MPFTAATIAYIAAAAAVIGAGTSAYGQVQSGKSQAAAGRQGGFAAATEGAQTQALQNRQATDVMAAARANAENIKRQSMLMRSSMLTSQSGSGVVIGEGSAQVALDQLDMLSSADALAAMFSGVNQASAIRTGGRFAQEASMNKSGALQQAGVNARNAGNIGATGTVISGIGSAAGAYGKASPSTVNQAPVVNRDVTRSP